MVCCRITPTCLPFHFGPKTWAKTATSAQQWLARPTPEQYTNPSQMHPPRRGISRRGQEPEPALPSLKIAQDLGESTGLGRLRCRDHEHTNAAGIIEHVPMAATILQSSILRSFRMRAINWSCSTVCFRAKRRSRAPNQ
jgi:hypothetical protein